MVSDKFCQKAQPRNQILLIGSFIPFFPFHVHMLSSIVDKLQAPIEEPMLASIFIIRHVDSVVQLVGFHEPLDAGVGEVFIHNHGPRVDVDLLVAEILGFRQSAHPEALRRLPLH